MRAVHAVTLTLTLAVTPAAIQAQPSPAALRRTIDVIAADSRGKPIETLSPADFAAVEDGVPQTILSAEFVRDSGRLVGIFLDEYHTTPGPAAERSRDALLQFVRTGLTADDRIAVLKPLDSLLTITFGDREAAAGAIETFAGRQGDYAPRSALERSLLAGTPARIDAGRNQIALSALNALATNLGAAKAGRKTLVVVSGGLQPRSRSRGDEPLPTLDSVVRSANRNQVSIYPIEVEGGTDEADEAARAALRALATETAGRTLSAADNLATGLSGLLADAGGYYLVTLKPAEQPPDDRFHLVDLQTTRKGVSLRARGGYWAAVPAPARSTRSGRAASALPPMANKFSPLIRPWFGMARGASGDTRVSFVWEPAPRVPGDRSRLKSPARIALKVARIDTGATVFDGAVLPSTGAVDAANPTESRATFELPPGRMRVRMSIEDSSSQQIDTDVRELVVGGFPGPLTLGTLQVLRAHSARAFQVLAQAGEAAPVAARQFSRAERLLIRAPVYASGSAPKVSATLASRFGSTRPLEVQRWETGGYQVDLPLAGLAGGDYVVEVTATNEDGTTHDSVAIRVTP